MAIVSAVLGAIAALTTLMGVLRITDALPESFIGAQYTWTFWFWISALLFLGAITAALNRKAQGD